MTTATQPSYPSFVPYYDRLLLRRIDDAGAAAQHPTFNFALTGAMQEKPQLFEVVAVGGGHLTDTGVTCPLQSLPGDRVLVGKYSGAGNEIKLDGEDYVCVRENEVLGRVSRLPTDSEIEAAFEAADGSFVIEKAAIVSATELPEVL
jgi:chaperonin GroES